MTNHLIAGVEVAYGFGEAVIVVDALDARQQRAVGATGVFVFYFTVYWIRCFLALARSGDHRERADGGISGCIAGDVHYSVFTPDEHLAAAVI